MIKKCRIKKGGIFCSFCSFCSFYSFSCYLFFVCLGIDLVPAAESVEANEFVFNRVAGYIKIKRDGVK